MSVASRYPKLDILKKFTPEFRVVMKTSIHILGDYKAGNQIRTFTFEPEGGDKVVINDR
ncbi:hypothetical protein KIN20_013316 [Parelaphostrongylus tenuis]|uniref:Uncharacterized protein n=1 Tax=Parelaphostrongylus tenuis TaxID=148309 RepID=A0AAD5MDA4_PARTN|nr:hypothetical protein KIN20_013316 [Parelaphostrongylus tenuis]